MTGLHSNIISGNRDYVFFSNFNCIPFGQGLTLSETITNELSNDLIYLPYFRILWGSSLKIGEVIEEKEIETLRCRHFVGKSRGPWCVRYQESGNQSNDVTFTCCTYRSLWDSSMRRSFDTEIRYHSFVRGAEKKAVLQLNISKYFYPCAIIGCPHTWTGTLPPKNYREQS